MGKQKQQVISRFFAPKPPPDPNPPPPWAPSPTSSPPTTSRVTATVSFSPSPAKRALSKALALPSSSSPLKKPRPPPPSDPSLHQRFLDKFLEPPLPRPPDENSVSLNPKYTPLEQQVVELKSRYPDVLLMVEVGYRYRFFGEDAETAARVLGIFCHMDHSFLTASIPTFRLNFHVRRLVGAGFKVGVVKQTETAAIKAHGANRLAPFTRELSALYTRATIEATDDLGGAREEGPGASESNYLLCVLDKEIPVENQLPGLHGGFDVKIGVVAVEISTGDVVHGEFNDNAMRSGLEAVILSLSPKEILMGNPLTHLTKKSLLSYAGCCSKARIEHASNCCFDNGGALAEVMSLYESVEKDTPKLKYSMASMQVMHEEGHHDGIERIMSMPELAVQALAVTIRYLKQFGFDRILCMSSSFRSLSTNTEIGLSANALHQLEITNNNSNGSLEGSLLQIMNHTCTSFGSRLLRHWVTHPLCDNHSISMRLDAVSEIAESMGSRRSLVEVVLTDEEPSSTIGLLGISHILSSVLRALGRMPDVQRGLMRVFHRTATPAEFVGVIHAILLAGRQLQQLHLEEDADSLEPLLQPIRSALLRKLILTVSSSTVITHAAKLLSSLNKDAADRGDMLNLFNASNDQFPEVVKGNADIEVALKKLDLLICEYRKKLRMRNLEFFAVSGVTHLIELASDVKVPSNWVKVNSTKKTVRYHPPEVLKALDELSLAKEELAVTCRVTWTRFLMEFGNYYAQFQAVIQALAALDCLYSLAVVSRNENYVRPVFVDNDDPCQIEIQSGRHPVLASRLGENFVPNDTKLHAVREYCQIVTGPNMGGKSCYIRQVALIVIMAQVGSFVPASSAKLHVVDGIYTRIGVSDGIQPGTSTFFEELSEASHILHHCSSRSLVIIDELGRGTSTHDGAAIAYATLHYLLEQKKCMVLFVTHYPKIMDIQHEFGESVGAYHVSYLTSEKPLKISNSESDISSGELDQSDITFLYKVVPGISEKSFGLNVARLAQLPFSCISRAATMAAKLEVEVNKRYRGGLEGKMLERVSHPDEIGTMSNPVKSEICQLEDGLHPFTQSLKSLFFLLRAAVKDDDPFNAFHSLNDARAIAQDLIK